MEPLRIGFIGCGRVTESHHLPALARLEGVRVTAVHDLDRPRAERVAGRFGVPVVCETPAALIERDDVDAVAVCVPATAHAELGCAALDAGKHLFMEKPLALTREDANRLVACGGKGGTLAAVGFNLRAHRLVEQARRIVASGVLGRIEVVRGVWTAGLRHRMELPAWRSRRATGGGALYEIAVHHFDLWRHLLGDEVEQIQASARSAAGDDEAVVLTARFASGALAAAAFAQGTSDSNEIEIFGDAGRLRLSIYRVDGLEHFSLGSRDSGIRSRLEGVARQMIGLPAAVAIARRGGVYLESFERQWRVFIDATRSGRLDASPLATLEDGQSAVEIMLAAAESADRGEPVAVAHAAGRAEVVAS